MYVTVTDAASVPSGPVTWLAVTMRGEAEQTLSPAPTFGMLRNWSSEYEQAVAERGAAAAGASQRTRDLAGL